MAITRGCTGIFLVGATPAAVGEVRNVSLSQNAEILDASKINDGCVKARSVGANEWGVAIQTWWDAADTTGQEVLDVGATVECEIGPEGNTTGDIKYSGSAVVQSVDISYGVDGIVERNFNLVGSTVLAAGTFA